MRYTAPLWLPSGHLQTIYPAVAIAKPAVEFRRERWDAHDGDFVDVDFVDGEPGKPFVVLFHGLEGSSNSHYARALMAAVAARGWSGAVPHFRGCSGEAEPGAALLPFGRRAGNRLDPAAPARRAPPASSTRSAFRWAATRCCAGWANRSTQAEIVDAACAVSAPLDLARGGESLSSGFNMLYTRMFLRIAETEVPGQAGPVPRPVRPRRAAGRARPVRLRQRGHRAAARLPRHRRLLEPRQRQARAA